MNASVKGALNQINTSYRAFTHKGKRMTKAEVKLVLEYAYMKGYETTDEIRDSEIDQLISLSK